MGSPAHLTPGVHGVEHRTVRRVPELQRQKKKITSFVGADRMRAMEGSQIIEGGDGRRGEERRGTMPEARRRLQEILTKGKQRANFRIMEPFSYLRRGTRCVGSACLWPPRRCCCCCTLKNNRSGSSTMCSAPLSPVPAKKKLFLWWRTPPHKKSHRH